MKVGVDQIKIVLNPIYGCIHCDIDTTLICPNPLGKGVWLFCLMGEMTSILDSGMAVCDLKDRHCALWLSDIHIFLYRYPVGLCSFFLFSKGVLCSLQNSFVHHVFPRA